MLHSALFMLANVTVISSEPIPADPWQETYHAECPGNSVTIARMIEDPVSPPVVTLNGKDVSEASGLAEELGVVGAAYRMSFLCSSSDEDVLIIRWVRGLAGDDGDVSYRSGAVSFSGDEVLDVEADDVSESDFWYR
ncbi:hypothetical protein LCM19_06300 [Qipengyuania flava]|nr:hypothetical protein [Qipengyuania flava]